MLQMSAVDIVEGIYANKDNISQVCNTLTFQLWNVLDRIASCALCACQLLDRITEAVTCLAGLQCTC